MATVGAYELTCRRSIIAISGYSRAALEPHWPMSKDAFLLQERFRQTDAPLMGERPMISRTISKTVTFARPFRLDGLNAIQPAGSYVVETDEELLQALSFPAYRRTDT